MFKGGPAAPKRYGPSWWIAAWVATAGLYAASFPPLAFDVLIFAAYLPVLIVAGVAPASGFRRGCLVGQAIMGGQQLYWITSMTNVGELRWLGWLAIVALYLIFALPLAWGLKAALFDRRWSAWLVLALAIPGHEILREWALSGLSWASPGYALGNRPLLIQLADVGGVHAVTVFVLLVNGGLAALVTRLKLGFGGPKALATGLFAVILALGYGGWRIETIDETLRPGPRVLGIQPNVTLAEREEVKRRRESPSRHFLARRLELLRRGMERAEGPVDLVVWPETSLPPLDESREAAKRVAYPPEALFASRGPLALAPRLAQATRLDARARQTGEGAPLHLLGLQIYSDLRPDEEAASPYGHAERNAALLVAHRDEGLVEVGRYAKNRLVPFGERLPRLPFRAALKELIDDRAGFAPALTPGSGTGLLSLGEGGPDFGTSICYEIIFPDLFAAQRRAGASFFVNISNDVWYGDSAEMELVHLALRFRAIENRRAIFRCGNTGISALLDPAGRECVVARSEGRRRHVQAHLVGQIPLGGPSPAPEFASFALRGVLAIAAALCALVALFGKSFRARDLGSEA
jgi:apolipoprotein N-acyltransferase